MKIMILVSQAARLHKTGSGGGLGISLEGTVDVEEGIEVRTLSKMSPTRDAREHFLKICGVLIKENIPSSNF